MLRFHAFPETAVNRQLYSPSSVVVTLKIIRVTCPLTQVTLTLEVKGCVTVTSGVAGAIVATLAPSSCKSTAMGSCARLNLQFSLLLIDPI